MIPTQDLHYLLNASLIYFSLSSSQKRLFVHSCLLKSRTSQTMGSLLSQVCWCGGISRMAKTQRNWISSSKSNQQSMLYICRICKVQKTEQYGYSKEHFASTGIQMKHSFEQQKTTTFILQSGVATPLQIAAIYVQKEGAIYNANWRCFYSSSR